MITVFTPTYNRAFIIGNLYESLKRQTSYNFEWIIIDDGSTDNTEKLIKKWLNEENKFSIIYKKIENGGKHRAHNLALNLAKGNLFMCVDSDDFLEDDAIEFSLKEWEKIEENDLIIAVSGLRAHYRKKQVIASEPIFDGYKDLYNYERKQYGIIGDTTEVFLTDLLRKYPFPEYEGEKFISEGFVWNRMAMDGYRFRCFNRVFTYCEYLKDGLSRNNYKLKIENPLGWGLTLKESKCFETLDYIEKRQFEYYERCHIFNNIFTDEEICTILEIDIEKCHYFTKKYVEFNSQLTHLINQNKIKTIAIYGIGNYGKRFLNYLKNIKVEVAYAIDKNYKECTEMLAYSLEDSLPKVDAVFITLNTVPQDLKMKIADKMSSAYIYMLQEIDRTIW